MTNDFFIHNRRILADSIDDKIIVLSGNDQLQQAKDQVYSFTQESNFWYLTGISQSNWLLIVDTKTRDEWLVQPDIGDVAEIFDGSLADDDASLTSGVKRVMTMQAGDELLKTFARQGRKVSTLGPDPHRKHYDFVENPAQAQLYRRLKREFGLVSDCRSVLSKLRAIKSSEEIAALTSAVDLTIDAFETIKSKLDQLRYEYQVQAEFDYYFAYRNSKHAYDPIVASGSNAITLHYNKNNDELKSGDLLLLDIGSLVNGYPADISRTWSIGNVSDRQQDVWRAVNDAHRHIVSMLRPGLSFDEYLSSVDSIMKKTLTSLKLSTTDYRKYFPHAISHGLGIDVHDSLGGFKEFQAGMVLTVEPGIYVKEEGIGVRIEDDILITESGYINLSERLSTEL